MRQDILWQKEYVYYKYIDGLDREITLRVVITTDHKLEWVDDYHNVPQSIQLGKKTLVGIMKGEVNLFDYVTMYKRGRKMKHETPNRNRPSTRKTIWQEGNYEITKNKNNYRLRVYNEHGTLITGIGINKSSYEMIRDRAVHPSYYIERSIKNG